MSRTQRLATACHTSKSRSHEELFDRFLGRMPKEVISERELPRSRLWRVPERWELAHET